MNAKGSRDRRSGTRRRGATTGHGDDAAPGRKLAAAALLRLHLRKRNGFGDEDAAPRSKMKLPGAAQRQGGRVADGSHWSCDTMLRFGEEEESETICVLERPKGQYIEYIGDTPQTLE